MRKHIVITRPAAEAKILAGVLRDKGFIPIVSPVLAIRSVNADLSDIDRFQALIFTSGNGARNFCAQSSRRNLVAYAVGEKTASILRESGFADVRDGGGTVSALEDFLKREALPQGAALLYISGDPISRVIDVPGLSIERRIIYKADQVLELTEEALLVLQRQQVAAVMFFSKRSAEAFMAAVENRIPKTSFMTTRALCLADSMIESARVLPWLSIEVAPAPDESGMLAMVDRLAATLKEKTVMTATADDQDIDALQEAAKIIERFGGIRPMANKMSVPVTTVQGWKKRNVIPGNRRNDVLRAAQVNNIDLSDLTSQPIANENSFGMTLKEEAAKTDEVAMGRHREAVATAEKIHQEGITGQKVEDVMRKIKKAEVSAVRKSAVVTVALLSASALAFVILLGPGMRGTTDNTVAPLNSEVKALQEDVSRLNGEVQGVKEEQSFLKKLIPEDLATQMDGLKQQAQGLQENVTALSQQVGQAAQTVLDPQAGDLGARLTLLEQQVAAMGASPDFAIVIDRLKSMQQSPEGQDLLSRSVAQLGQLVGAGQPDQIEPQLQAVQGQDSPLGKTLEGVPQTDLKAAALLMGLVQFRNSLNRSAPFEEDLALLQNMVGTDNPELNDAIIRLAPQAKYGVLSKDGLSNELRGLAGDIVVSSLQGEDVSLREKAQARLNDVLQVQKNGELVTGTDTQARVARAQLLLDQGDISGAITELEALEGPARQKAQPLIDNAQMTALAEKVQGMLTTEALGNLGGGSNAPYASGVGLESLLKDLEKAGRDQAATMFHDPATGVRILDPGPRLPH